MSKKGEGDQRIFINFDSARYGLTFLNLLIGVFLNFVFDPKLDPLLNLFSTQQTSFYFARNLEL